MHKSVFRGVQISECLMMLDNLCREVYEHLKPYLNKDLTAISKLQMQFTSFSKGFQDH